MRNLLFIVMLLLSAVPGMEAKTEKGRAIYNHPTWRKTTPPPHYDVVLKDNEKMHDFIIDNIVFRLYSGADSVCVVPRYANDDTYDCCYKKNLIIPDSVVYNGKTYPVCWLGEYDIPHSFEEDTVLAGYAQLDYVSLPKAMKYVLDCINADTIDVPSLSFLDSCRRRGEYSIYGWVSGSPGQTVLCNNGSVVHDLQLPEGIKDINLKYSAFRLRSITFPSSLKKLGKYFTFGNQYLERCVFKGGPDSLSGKFYIDSPNLKELVLPSTLRYVDGNFISILMVPVAVLPSTLEYVRGTYEQCCDLLRLRPSFPWKNVWITVKDEKNQNKNMVIPEGVKEVGGFRQHYNIEKLTLSSTVEKISDEAFYLCENLKEINIPNNSNLKEIGVNAFRGTCVSHVSLPNTVERIRSNAFWDTELDSIRLPANPNLKIEWGALYEVDAVEIPYGVTSISDGALGGTAISTIDIPNSVTSIGWLAFANCWRLKTVKMSNNTEIIMKDAFKGTKVTEFRLPKSLKLISRDAFERSGLLTDIYVYGPPASIIEAEGNGPSPRWKLHVLPVYKEAYETADYWKDFFSIETFEPVGIHAVKNENQVEEECYDLQGRKQGSGVHGISIIKTSDGKTKKVWRR